MFDKAANVDEFNVAHAAERLAAQKASHRIMVVLADGMTRGSVQSLAETVHSVEHAGATVLGIGVGDDTVRSAYSRAEVVEQPLDLATAMVDGVRSTLYRTIAASGSDVWWVNAGGRVLEDMSTQQ
jgi:cobalamin biosynthesis protein CobT